MLIKFEDLQAKVLDLLRTNKEMERMAKQMLYGEDARRKLLEGIDGGQRRKGDVGTCC